MRVNLKQLELLPGQSKTVTQQMTGSPDWLEGMRAAFDAPISVEMQIEQTGKYWVIKGTVTARLRMTCSRCLEEFPHTAAGNFERIAVAADAKSLRFMEDAETHLTVEEGLADISQAVEETLILNLPIVPLCSEDCSGLCAVCGQNLNVRVCGCSNDVIDPRLEKLRELL